MERAADIIRFDFTGDDENLSGLLSQLVGEGHRIISFSEEIGDLEDVFMRVTKGVVN